MDMVNLQIKYEQNAGLMDFNRPRQDSFCPITVSQFSKICRTCLVYSLEAKSIYDVVGDNVSVIFLLENYAAIQALATDYMPQNICNTCIAELLRFHNFKEKCQSNETLLKNIYKVTVIDIPKDYPEIVEFTKNGSNLATTYPEYRENGKTENPENDSNLATPCTKYEEDHCEQSTENFTNTNTSESESEEKKPRRVRQTRSNQQLSRVRSKKLPFKCRDCEKVCDTREMLTEHRKEAKHPEHRTHACTECGKLFTSSKLRQHMRAHTKEKPYVCKICSHGFSMSGNLKRHMMTHTGERPHVCEICGKGFIQSTTLVNHRRTHSTIEKTGDNGTPKFLCNYCGRGFKRLARYNAHLKRHFSDPSSKVQRREEATDGEVREYICDICKRAYKTKHLLKAHQLTHGEKTFLCSDCGKGFVTKAALHSHLKVHTGEKPHTCNVCKKSFAHVGSFEAHMLIHTGLKPYNCSICTKSFTQLSHLKYHLRTHSGERPYLCGYCGKSFALKGNLTVHVRIHTGETPYVCPVCGKGFYDSSSMKKHRRGHGEVNTNQQLTSVDPGMETGTILPLTTAQEAVLSQSTLIELQVANDHAVIINCKY